MSTQYSTALENFLAATGSLKAAIDNCLIDIWAGPVPAGPDLAVDGTCVKLVTISVGGAGTACTWDGSPANGVLSKTASEIWKGTIAASGTAAFFRIYVPTVGGTTDDGAAADTSAVFHRVQGSVGVNANFDMILPDVALVASNTQEIGTGQLL